jgi:hypothetical protein
MKALLFLYLLLSGVAYAENKPAPRASPIDPNEWIKDPDPEPRWISPPLIQRKNDWTKVGTRVPGLSVQQICKRGFVFRYDATSVDGKQYRWVFEFTKTDVPFPVILDLPKEPYQEELNALYCGNGGSGDRLRLDEREGEGVNVLTGGNLNTDITDRS